MEYSTEHPRKSFMELLNTKNRYCTGNHMYYEYFERDSGRNLKNKQDENQLLASLLKCRVINCWLSPFYYLTITRA